MPRPRGRLALATAITVLAATTAVAEVLAPPPPHDAGSTPAPLVPVNGVLQPPRPESHSEAPTASGVLPPSSQAVVINFDDFDAPCTFQETAPLHDRYAALGVRFSGSSDSNGGAVLNECGGFDVSGQSSPNFVGFYTQGGYPTGGRTEGPETIFFDPAASSMQINAGSADGGVVTLTAYGPSGSVVGVTSLTSESALATLSVEAPEIARVVITFTGSTLVLDDLAYVSGPPDQDGDGLGDAAELEHGTNPNDPDTDDDGLLDGFEVKYGFDPLVGGQQSLDPDGDGLDNLAEQQYGTDPTRADTDGDGLNDRREVLVYGTDPHQLDTDGGGVGDGDEVDLHGTNPLDPTDDLHINYGMVMDDFGHSAVVFDPDTLGVRGAVPAGEYSGLVGDCAITADARWGLSSDFYYRAWVTDLKSSPPRPADGTHVIYVSYPGEDVSLSPDERFLLVCSGSELYRGIAVIDLASRRQVGTYFDGTECSSLEACADGSVLVTSWHGNYVRRLLIDEIGRLTDTGEALTVENPQNASCAPDSHTGIVLGYAERTVTSFQLHGMVFASQRTITTNSPVSAAFSPDGGRVYVRSLSGIDAFVYDPGTGLFGPTLFRTFAGTVQAYFGVEQLGIDRTGTRLFVPETSQVRVLDALNGTPVGVMTHPSIISATGICFPAPHDGDHDGLPDLYEHAHGTDPTAPDTDGDGLKDGFEVANGFDPLVAGEAHLDPDGDGLDNLGEQAAGSDPHDADSDHDGLDDGREVNVIGSSPISPDTDGDAQGDASDNCPTVANPGQGDTVHPNGRGDACDDPDLDRIADAVDVCPDVSDPGQQDSDHDGNGDACDPCPLVPSHGACVAVTEDGGSCLESRIELLQPHQHGRVSILADTSVPPESLRFEVLDSSCAPGDFFVFILNGYLLGNMPADPSNGCTCTPGLQTFTVKDPSLLGSHWNIGGYNEFKFRKIGTSATFAWVRVVVDKDVAQETECLFDVNDGSCTEPNLCAAGYTFSEINVSAYRTDDITGPVRLIDVPYGESSLPRTMDISSLENRAYSLCVDTIGDDPGTLYAASEEGTLAAVNLSTAQASPVGLLPYPASEIEYDPVTGRAFEQFLTINSGQEFSVANGTAIGRQIDTNIVFESLEWVGSKLYGGTYQDQFGPYSLSILDPYKGGATPVGPTSLDRLLAGLAYDETTQTLYGLTSYPSGQLSDLVTVDLTTGHATTIGPTGIYGESLEFGPDGALYAGTSAFDHGRLYRIDPHTGAATIIGPTGLPDVTGLMLVTPAPKTDCHPFTRHGERTLTINGAPCGSPPVAAIAGGGSSECSSPAGALVTLDGTASSDADSTPGTSDDIVAYDWFENFGEPLQASLGSGAVIAPTLLLGTHRITLQVTDRTGYTGNASSTRAVVDTVPPDLSLAVSPTTLAPPNHRMVDIAATVVATDRCGGRSLILKAVTSSEPDDAAGPLDGATTGDIQDAAIGTEDLAFRLRAERNGGGSGRSYSVVYRAVDGSGNGSERTATVVVPHDNGGVVDPLSLTVQKSGAAALVQWTPAAGALYYNVIRGDLSQLRDVDGVHRLGAVTCLATHSALTNASDAPTPAPGHGAFYLVEFNDGRPSSYGSESAGKETVVTAADGACP